MSVCLRECLSVKLIRIKMTQYLTSVGIVSVKIFRILTVIFRSSGLKFTVRRGSFPSVGRKANILWYITPRKPVRPHVLRHCQNQHQCDHNKAIPVATSQRTGLQQRRCQICDWKDRLRGARTFKRNKNRFLVIPLEEELAAGEYQLQLTYQTEFDSSDVFKDSSTITRTLIMSRGNFLYLCCE